MGPCSKEKKDLPQSQHKWVWNLIDDHGHEHAAVEGLERDTRDGHYEYRALEPFSSIRPLSVTSMAKVEDWLDKVGPQRLCPVNLLSLL